MIQNQKELLKELKELKSKYNVVGIKSSFEDEGVQFNELIRLKQLCNLSNIVLITHYAKEINVMKAMRSFIKNKSIFKKTVLIRIRDQNKL